MRKCRFLSMPAIILALFGCGGLNRSPQSDAPKQKEAVKMRYEGKEVSFEPSYATFSTIRKGLILKPSDIHDKAERTDAVVHRIYLANYDLELTDAKKQDMRHINSDGQFRVEIQIEADENADENVQLKVGEYTYQPTPFDRISYVFLSYFKEGRDRSENLQTSEFAGKIRITSASNNEIKGEIDVFDKNEYVKGSFTATRLGKK